MSEREVCSQILLHCIHKTIIVAVMMRTLNIQVYMHLATLLAARGSFSHHMSAALVKLHIYDGEWLCVSTPHQYSLLFCFDALSDDEEDEGDYEPSPVAKKPAAKKPAAKSKIADSDGNSPESETNIS
jgi:hypothetical protein